MHTKGLNVTEGIVLSKQSPEGFPYVNLRNEETFIMVNTVRHPVDQGLVMDPSY